MPLNISPTLSERIEPHTPWRSSDRLRSLLVNFSFPGASGLPPAPGGPSAVYIGHTPRGPGAVGAW